MQMKQLNDKEKERERGKTPEGGFQAPLAPASSSAMHIQKPEALKSSLILIKNAFYFCGFLLTQYPV